MKYILLVTLVACAAYTDPNQEKLTYFKCEKNQTVVVKHADDYESILIKVGKEQILLHHFVQENGEGYGNERFLWMTKGKMAKLITRKADGSEAEVLGNCKSQKPDLDF